MMRLTMQSEFSTVLIAAAAILGALSVAWLYTRETRSLPLPHRFLLPSLRALAIMMVILMLAGPVIEYRKEIGQFPTVHLFIDASSSMLRDDVESNGKPMTRLQRAEQLVFGNADQLGILPQLKDTHKVRCYVLSGDQAVALRDSDSDSEAAKSDVPPPSLTDHSQSLNASSITDLSNPLAKSFDRLMNAASQSSEQADSSDAEKVNKAADNGDQPQSAESVTGSTHHADTIVLLSDGQHNVGPSPEALAKRLGDLSVPIYSIGFGQTKERMI